MAGDKLIKLHNWDSQLFRTNTSFSLSSWISMNCGLRSASVTRRRSLCSHNVITIKHQRIIADILDVIYVVYETNINSDPMHHRYCRRSWQLHKAVIRLYCLKVRHWRMSPIDSGVDLILQLLKIVVGRLDISVLQFWHHIDTIFTKCRDIDTIYIVWYGMVRLTTKNVHSKTGNNHCASDGCWV